MIHELKTWPGYFNEVWTGSKLFELRKSDRPFAIGDKLHLREWWPNAKQYSGREITADISYILQGGMFGLEEGYCIMSLTNFNKHLIYA